MTREITIHKHDHKVQIIIGDPDASDNSNQKINLTEIEAAWLIVKLQMAFEGIS